MFVLLIVLVAIIWGFDYFFPDRDDFVSAVINRTSELVANVYAKPTTIVQHTVTLFPNKVEIINIRFVAIVEAYLIVRTIIF